MEPNHEEFKAALEVARRDFEAGRPGDAVDGIISAPWAWRYGKDPERIKLLRELYEKVESPFTEECARRNPHQLKLLFELYSLWPKIHLEAAILKHSFPEPPSDPYAVSGAESVQLAARSVGFGIGPGRPTALSRGRHWLKLWDVETGEVIYAAEHSLELQASFIGRDTTHVMFAQSFNLSSGTLCWSASFRETLRHVFCPAARSPSNSESLQHYRVRGEIERMVSVGGRREDIVHEVTVRHEEIEGYLPAGTTTFIARSNEYYGAQVDDFRSGDQINAVLAVDNDERWLQQIIGPGRGLRGMYGFTPTTPITCMVLSADGTLALRNGNDNTFGIWNVWTGDRLREFAGHRDRVTCLGVSVDLSIALSGSEDHTIKLWQPISAECVRTLVGHNSAITAVCISLDATKILSADRDGIIILWDRETGGCLRTIQAHSQGIAGLHLTMDGKFAVSGSGDKTVKLWNLADGSCMKSLEHTDWVTSVDMTPDGKYLVASSYGETKVWELAWKLEPRDIAEWDEGARTYMEILLHANGAWDGKLGTPVDMTEQEKINTLRRQGPSWTSWHAPSEKNDWHRVWHLNWNIGETLGHVGYGWLSEAGREGTTYLDHWWTAHRAAQKTNE
jgi:WD40 repeat protein